MLLLLSSSKLPCIMRARHDERNQHERANGKEQPKKYVSEMSSA
jgi:hypothetical protein